MMMLVIGWLLLFAPAAADVAQHVRKGNELLRAQRIEEAKREIEEALKENPRYVPAWTLKGRLAMAAGDNAGARDAFSRAAELAPDAAGAQFLLGFFYYIENDFTRARAPLEKARKLGDLRAPLFLALNLDGLALPAEAAPLYQEAVRIEERSKGPAVEARVAYARFLFVLGQREEAQAVIARALAANPRSREAHYEQARLHAEAANPAACVTEALAALNLPGEGVSDRQIHFLLARAYGLLGNSERAVYHKQRMEALPAGVVR